MPDPTGTIHTVFVCLGNICRSPVAEALARQISPPYLTFESAGTEDYHVGLGAHSLMTEVAAGRGLDLGKHSAQQMDRAMFDRADHVIAMDSDVLATISNEYGVVEASLLRPGVEIHDPYGYPRSAFDDCIDHLRSEIELLVASLVDSHEPVSDKF